MQFKQTKTLITAKVNKEIYDYAKLNKMSLNELLETYHHKETTKLESMAQSIERLERLMTVIVDRSIGANTSS